MSILTEEVAAKDSQLTMSERFDRLQQLQHKHRFDEMLFNFVPHRVKVAMLIHSNCFNAFITACVFLSIAIVIYETDCKAAEQQVDVWVQPTLIALLCVYIVEVSLRFFVSGHKFFWASLNIVDLVLVVVELATLMLEALGGDFPNVMVIRFFRLIRLARFSSVLMRFQAVYLIVQGFFGAMQAILFATILVVMVITLWSILTVELLHPIAQALEAEGRFGDCGRCIYAYSSVMETNKSFWQTMIIGDSWGDLVIPFIERDWKCIFVFLGVFMTVPLGLLNLILSVIVDSAASAREEDEQRKLHEKNQAFKQAQARFHKLCYHLDADQSGTLSEKELHEGLATHPDLGSLLTVMDITEEEISVLFKMMDVDGSREVSYAEFTDMLYRFKHDDIRTQLMFLKHYVLEMTSRMDQQLGKSFKTMERWHCVASGTSNLIDHNTRTAPRTSESSSASFDRTFERTFSAMSHQRPIQRVMSHQRPSRIRTSFRDKEKAYVDLLPTGDAQASAARAFRSTPEDQWNEIKIKSPPASADDSRHVHGGCALNSSHMADDRFGRAALGCQGCAGLRTHHPGNARTAEGKFVGDGSSGDVERFDANIMAV